MNNTELAEKCKDKLKSISQNVVSQDRKDVMAEFGVSYITVSRYLKGEVGDVGLGVKMLEFLNDRIRERKKAVLSATV